MRQLIEAAQEIDSLQILVAAVDVRNPLAGFARVIQIQHGRHRIHPQPVNMIRFQPKQGVRDEEGPDFIPPIIEDQRAPLAMLALARISVFIERGPIEMSQAVGILWKMARYPIDNHAEAGLMAAVDEIHEILRRSKTRCGRVKARHLITPRAGKRMLHHGQQFQVRVAKMGGVIHQLLGQLAIAQVGIVGAAQPGAQMHFVNRNGLLQMILASAFLHPSLIVPLVGGKIANHGSGLRRNLGAESIGIGLLLPKLARRSSHGIFVVRARTHSG